MEVVRSSKYLGVVVSSDLSWSSHIQLVCMKAKKILRLIYRNLAKYTSDSSVIVKMYKALVRPHLEYAAQVWSPYTVKDIELLEKVQRFALCICSHNYNLSYEELLDLFKIPSLQNRHSFLSLCTFYNIIRGFVFFPSHSLPILVLIIPLFIELHLHTPLLYSIHLCIQLFHCLKTYHMMLQNLLLLIGLNTSYLLCFLSLFHNLNY